MSKYVDNLPVNEWRFIETFALNHASGQFRPTGHLYKMSFVTGTQVIRCDPISDSSYLSLVRFSDIQTGELNPHILVGMSANFLFVSAQLYSLKIFIIV